METSYSYNLKKLLEYSKKGEFEKTGAIEFAKPGMEVYAEFKAIKQSVMQAIMDAKRLHDQGDVPDDDEQSGDGELDANAIRIMLDSSSIDHKKLLDQFKAIAFKTATLDGDGVKIIDAHFDKMEIDDVEDMIAGYIANFIVPSLFSMGK